MEFLEKNTQNSPLIASQWPVLNNWAVQSCTRIQIFYETEELTEDWLWGPPNLITNGYWEDFSVMVMRPGHEADHPTLSAPTYIVIAWCLVKQEMSS
jgi:hypothetical protein